MSEDPLRTTRSPVVFRERIMPMTAYVDKAFSGPAATYDEPSGVFVGPDGRLVCAVPDGLAVAKLLVYQGSSYAWMLCIGVKAAIDEAKVKTNEIFNALVEVQSFLDTKNMVFITA